MFAAVEGNIIRIYSFTTFENILSLKGHNEKVSQAGTFINVSQIRNQICHHMLYLFYLSIIM